MSPAELCTYIGSNVCAFLEASYDVVAIAVLPCAVTASWAQAVQHTYSPAAPMCTAPSREGTVRRLRQDCITR
jgi:hypothetical protein